MSLTFGIVYDRIRNQKVPNSIYILPGGYMKVSDAEADALFRERLLRLNGGKDIIVHKRGKVLVAIMSNTEKPTEETAQEQFDRHELQLPRGDRE